MSFCCSCFPCCVEATKDETTPLSKESRSRKQVKVLEKGSKMDLKKVNVQESDEKFSDIAVLYNTQVEHHEMMTSCLSQLNDANNSTNLTSCIEKLKTKYSNYDIQIQMEGYNFSLLVKATEDIPVDLKETQELIKQLSRATKLLIGSQTKLGGMVFSVTQEKTEMANKIKEANTGYLDQIRLVNNLEENIQIIDQAKELSKECQEEANNVLREIADITGVQM